MKKQLLNIFGIFCLTILGLNAMTAVAQPTKNADLQRGIELIETEDYKAAIASLNKCAVAADLAVKGECLQHRGLAFQRNNETVKAHADFNAAVRIDPKNESAYFARARFLINNKGVEAALPDFNQVIKLNPKNADAFFFRGQIYSESNMHQQAIADFTEAIKIKPDYNQAFLLRAYEYFDADELDKVIADLTKFIELQPENYEGYFQRGVAYQQKGDKKLAEIDYRQAMKLQPELPGLKEALNELDLTKEEVVKKAEELGKEGNADNVISFLKLFPEYGEEVEILYQKSVSFAEAREYRKADIYFQKQFDKFYDSAVSSLAVGDEYAAKPKSKENSEMAALMYSTAMVGFGSAGLVNSLRAVATEKNGLPAIKRNPKNLKGFTESVKLFEETALKTAQLDFEAENFDSALENYRKAIELNPKSKTAFEGRAKVYRKLGSNRLAVADEAKAKLLKSPK